MHRPKPKEKIMITGKRIVLTGANSGIGLETLKLLANGDNKILAVDLRRDKIDEFDPNKVIAMICDVSKKENVDSIFDKATEVLGGIDIFYANAGYPYYEKMDYVDWERTSRIFETNVLSPIYTYEKYREYLGGKDGHYAITVSAIGKLAIPGYALYSSSKFAMNGFQQAIRFEKPENMKLTCLYPVATNTGFFKAANPKDFEKPFPVQKPAHVAKAMYKGLEKGKKHVNPCKLFSLAQFLFAICPPIKWVYLGMENAKLKRFVAKG